MNWKNYLKIMIRLVSDSQDLINQLLFLTINNPQSHKYFNRF